MQDMTHKLSKPSEPNE